MACSLKQSEVPRKKDEKYEKYTPRKYQYVYINICFFSYCHVAALYGLFLCFTSAKWATILFEYIVFTLAGYGLTAGAHRLWSHRSYKAKFPLQIILMICHSISFQYSIIWWARDHRLHHKYTDTDSDPTNASRGFFFAHIGWLFVKKHPELIKRGKETDMSDLYNNPILRFQKKYWKIFTPLVAFVIPTLIPVFFWRESINVAWHVNMLRFITNLNITCMFNSVAHMWGGKPYDRNLSATQSISTSLISLGDGFHNYHHVFPSDYRAAELGNNKLNQTKWFIDLFAWIGWAYDRKVMCDELVKKRALNTGDGSNAWGST